MRLSDLDAGRHKLTSQLDANRKDVKRERERGSERRRSALAVAASGGTRKQTP